MVQGINKAYQHRKTDYEGKLRKKKKYVDLLVFLRSAVFIFAIALSMFYAFSESRPSYLFFTGFLLVIFGVLVAIHNRVKDDVKYLKNLFDINDKALTRLSGEWTAFSDSGENFIQSEHPYTRDLNIFGQGSLFQYINATTSFMGEQKLANMLRARTDLDTVLQRQKAVKELSSQIDWRQHFQAVGLGSINKKQNPTKLLAWAEDKPLLVINRFLFFIRFLPIFTLGLAILAILNITASYLWSVPLVIQIIVVALTEKVARKAFAATGNVTNELYSYSALLRSIEKQVFNTKLLARLRGRLKTGGCTPSQQIKILFKIAERMKLRYSSIHVIINILVLWDLHILISLERWKSRSGRSLRSWLEVIGDLEALSSLAGLDYDHPDWVLPDVSDSEPAFEATGLGHPLIKEDLRVCNDVSLPIPGTILIITGSNMSGKSTLLRTVGINLVLAYAGGPVCAKKMYCSLMDVYSSMQISDNLEQRISTFYAELKRIKLIVDAAKKGKPVIFLVDEIFKGTNSKDRILGAKAVIRNLNKQYTIGLVSTHDLELSNLEKESPLIGNYHFTDEISGEKISFDYRLKPGVSHSTNAIALMNIVGIKVQE